jgi:glycosyltransferase involved in cell wall biosynthesis
VRLTVVSVAYALAAVSPDSAGGAEQVLRHIDARLVERGHRSIVVACDGSRVTGELVTTPAPPGSYDEGVRAAAAERQRRTLLSVLAHRSVDVVHFHGHDFDRCLPSDDGPVLATIHLPPELLVADLRSVRRPHTWMHGVSQTQQARLPALPNVLPPIENGVSVDALPRQLTRRTFALAFGRICPEKGFHLGLDAARLARAPLLLGGSVFPYEAHQRYFEREILPRTDRDRRFVGPLSRARKRRLLNSTRCLLIPSQVPETSSLVAMEALACGTPVVAFRAGALPEIIEHGVTGFIVDGVEQMAAAIRRAHTIDPDACRRAARTRFSAARMADTYLERYERMLEWSATSSSIPAPSSNG